jgi:hypothetical protein
MEYSGEVVAGTAKDRINKNSQNSFFMFGSEGEERGLRKVKIVNSRKRGIKRTRSA